MNEERFAIHLFMLLAAESANGMTPTQANHDADLWIAGVRDHNISDFTAVHMPKCRNFAYDCTIQIGASKS